MPCRCTGVRLARCDCGLYGSQSLGNSTTAYYRSEGVPRPKRYQATSHGLLTKRGNSLVTLIVERLYEKCAGYNLRYCPFRGFVGNENHLSNALRDLVILCCFLVANFVVFMMIATRMSVQLIFLIFESAKWLRRVVVSTRSNMIITTSDSDTPRFEVDYRNKPS